MATKIKWTGSGYEKTQTSKQEIAEENKARKEKAASGAPKSSSPKKATQSTGIINATSGPASSAATKTAPGAVATPALDSATGTQHNAGMPGVQQAAKAARQSVVPSMWGGREGTEGGGEKAEHIAGSIVNKAAAGLVGGLRDRVNYYGGTIWQDAADTAKDTARAVGMNEQFAADFDRDPEAMKPFNDWKASLKPGEYEALEMSGQLPDPRAMYANAKQQEAEEAYRAENGELELHRIANFGQKFQDETQEKYGDVGGFWGMVGDAASSIGDQAPAMALRRIPLPFVGAALSTAYLYGGAAQRGTEQALAEGASAEDALSYGTMSGIMEAATERMFDGMSGLLGKGAADDAIESLLKHIGNTGARNLARWGLGAAGEGVEELISALADPALKTIYNHQDLAESYGNLDWGDVMYQSMMGLLTGGILGSVGFVNGQYRAKNDSVEAQLAAEMANNLAQTKQGQAILQKAQANQQTEAQTPTATQELASALTGEQTETTSVDTNPAEHTKAEQKTIEEYQNATDSNLVHFIEDAIANRGQNKMRYDLNPVSEQAANDIKRLTGANVAGSRTVLEQRMAEHMYDRHGPSGEADTSMRDLNDFGRIQYILDHYDNITDGGTTKAYVSPDENGKNRPAKTVVFSKAVNGTYYVVEAVPDTRRNTVYIVSAYMTNNLAEAKIADASAPAYTAETASMPSATDTVAQSPPIVNGENSGTVRSQSEENTIQAMDAQLNAPEEVRNPIYYNPVSEEESVSAARNFLQNGYQSNNAPGRVNSKLTAEQGEALTQAGQRLGGGYGQAMSDMQGSGSWTSVQQDMSTLILEALAEDAEATGNWDAYEAWRIVDAEHGQEIARTLQARGKRTRGKTVDILDYVSKSIAESGMSKEARDAALTKVLPLAQEYQNADAADADAMRDIILRVSEARKTGTIFKKNLNKLLNKQDAAYLAQLAEASIKGMAADYTPVDVGSKLKSYQTIAQLLKVTTAMRNLGGNESFGILDALVGDTVGQAIDSLVKTKTGARSVAFDTRWFSSEQRKAARDALAKSVLEVALDVDMGTVGNKYDPRGRSFRMNGGPAERFMSRLSQILSYSLSSSDALFRGGIEAGTEASLNRMNAGNEAALNQSGDVAESVAAYRLFQNQGKTATMAKDFHDRLNGILGTGGEVENGKRTGGFGLGDLIMPYATVPANLGVKAFEYSPAGIVKGGIDLAKVLKSAKNGNVNLKAQNNAVMEIARGTAGVPLAILFASLIKAGIVKRSDDEDDYNVTKARMAENRKETQWNLDATIRWLQGGSRDWKEGDKLVSLNWAEPINAFMDIGSLFNDLREEQEDANALDYAGNYAYGAIHSFTEMPMIEGLQSAINAMRYTDSENIGEKLGAFAESSATSAVTGMIPGLVTQAGRVMDPVTRDTGGDTAPERFANAVMNTLPGLREKLPEKLDSFGNPIEEENALLNALNSTVLPGTITEYAPDDVVKALDDVYAATGKSNFYPDYKAPASFDYDDASYELTTEEKRKWQQDFGQNYTALVRAAIDSDSYDRMDAETMAKVFSEIRSMAAAEAKGAIVDGRGGKFESEYDKVLKLSDVAGYVSTKAMFSSASDPKDRDYGAMAGILEDYKRLPVDVRERLDEWSKNAIPRLYEATQKGVSAENWYKAYDATKALKPVTGADEVANWQTYEAITGAGLKDKDVDVILGQHLGKNQYTEYQTARAAGISPTSWSRAYSAVAQLKPVEGAAGVKDWQKFDAILQTGKSEKEIDTLLHAWMADDKSIQARYDLGRERGFTQKTLVNAYRITSTYSKKDDILGALKDEGYSKWQSEFLYYLYKGQKTVKEADKFRKQWGY